MTFLQQRKFFVFCINRHLPRNGRQFEFGGNFGSYINYNKTETFLMPSVTYCKKFFLKQIAAILKLVIIVTSKRKIRDGNKPGST